MSVLILRHDLLDLARRRRSAGPGKDVSQDKKMCKLGSQLAEELRRDATDRGHWHVAHVEKYDVQGAKVSSSA